jgi:hypothetical protein
MLDDGGGGEKTLLPEHLITHLAHPLVAAMPPETRRYTVAQHLYQYLRFTVHFETAVVNWATELLAHGRSGLELPYRTPPGEPRGRGRRDRTRRTSVARLGPGTHEAGQCHGDPRVGGRAVSRGRAAVARCR